jgi:hypothetical protein
MVKISLMIPITECPTCHLEYFTKGILVWAPPLEILQWIYKRMMGKKEVFEIRQVVSLSSLAQLCTYLLPDLLGAGLGKGLSR